MIRKFIAFGFFLLLVSSCSSKKDILFLQDIDKYPSIDILNNSEKIQPNDILKIKVSALIPPTALPFNKASITGEQNTDTDLEIMKLEGYLVSEKKTIKFPVLGEISVDNKSILELEDEIKKNLISGGYLNNPTVTVRFLNAKFTILGEVNNPGTFNFTDNKINFFQGLGMAGGLNINADRQNLILIRDIEGKRKTFNIDLTKSEWLDSPYQNIRRNDVILVNPNKSKIKSAGFIGSVSDILSLASIILTSIVIINN